VPPVNAATFKHFVLGRPWRSQTRPWRTPVDMTPLLPRRACSGSSRCSQRRARAEYQLAGLALLPYDAASSESNVPSLCRDPALTRATPRTQTARRGPNLNQASASFHLLDDHRDGARVHLGLLHEHGCSLDVVGVDRIEEVFDPSEGVKLLH
jgi:hypothetical protein